MGQSVTKTVEGDFTAAAGNLIKAVFKPAKALSKLGSKVDASTPPTRKVPHGNRADDRPGTLYEKYDRDGNFRKHGVTQEADPTRPGSLLEKVTEGANVEWKHYIFADGDPVALYERHLSGTATTWYMLKDHLGSVDALSDTNGGVFVRPSYVRLKDLGYLGVSSADGCTRSMASAALLRPSAVSRQPSAVPVGMRPASGSRSPSQ